MAPNAANCIRVPGLVLCENWTTRLREADTWQVQAQFAIACPLEKPNGGRYPKMRRRRVVDGPVSFDENVKHWLRGSRMRGAKGTLIQNEEEVKFGSFTKLPRQSSQPGFRS